MRTAPAPAVPARDTTTDVSGHWQLNTHDSDDPRSMMHRDSTGGGMEGRRGMGGGRGGGGGGGFGGGYGGGRGGGRGGMGGGGGRMGGGGGASYGDRQARNDLFDLAFQAPTQLDLVDADTTFSLIADGADTVVLRTNGHKLKETGDANVSIELRARRRDGRLEVERHVGSAGKITETYFMSPAGDQLFVLVKFEPSMGRGPVTFRRVYDRRPAASS